MSLRGLTGPLPARTGRLLHAQLPPRAVGEQGQQGDKPGQVLRQIAVPSPRIELNWCRLVQLGLDWTRLT